MMLPRWRFFFAIRFIFARCRHAIADAAPLLIDAAVFASAATFHAAIYCLMPLRCFAISLPFVVAIRMLPIFRLYAADVSRCAGALCFFAADYAACFIVACLCCHIYAIADAARQLLFTGAIRYFSDNMAPLPLLLMRASLDADTPPFAA